MDTIRYATDETALGLVLAGWTGAGLCAVFLGDSSDELTAELRRRFPRRQVVAGGEALAPDLARVVEAVEGRSIDTGMVLDLAGTAFQRRVWTALQQIPSGETASYRDLAESIGAPGAVRAVAQACGANPVSVIVPCHRVVASDGGLGGYHWGVERKRKLLEREGAGVLEC